VKASKRVKRTIAAVENKGGEEPSQKPLSDAQKAKLTSVTEKLAEVKGKLEKMINEAKGVGSER
jgi:hypothetical protein